MSILTRFVDRVQHELSGCDLLAVDQGFHAELKEIVYLT